jgi:hypothetical protein
VTAGGFRVDAAPLTTFSRHLDELESNLKSTGGLMASMVADVGMFGIVGQLFAAGASKWCAEAGDQLNTYAGTIGEFAEKVTQAAKAYDSGEADTVDTIVRLDK